MVVPCGQVAVAFSPLGAVPGLRRANVAALSVKNVAFLLHTDTHTVGGTRQGAVQRTLTLLCSCWYRMGWCRMGSQQIALQSGAFTAQLDWMTHAGRSRFKDGSAEH